MYSKQEVKGGLFLILAEVQTGDLLQQVSKQETAGDVLKC